MAGEWLSRRHIAARKQRRKRSKLQRNAFGCVNVGMPCRGNDDNCCSGICEGKRPKRGNKDKSKCVAHNGDDCPVGADSCLEDLVLCTNGFCYQTTGQASFCAGGGVCHDCTRDTDCEPLFGEGAACAVCPDCGSNTSCLSVTYSGAREPKRERQHRARSS